VLQDELSTFFSKKNPLQHESFFYRILNLWYSNPNRRDRTPQCLALRYHILENIDNVVEYKIRTSLFYSGLCL